MNFTSLLNRIKQSEEKKVVAVAQAEDTEVLKAVQHAILEDIAVFILVGDEGKITELASQIGLDVTDSHIQIEHAGSHKLSAEIAVKLIHQNKADVLMKGNIPTKLILKEVLNKEYGLRTNQILSHVAAFEIPNQDRLIFLTDAAMNISPDLSEKAKIIQNAANVAQQIGVENPKVAVVAAVEVVNPNMQATVDAAALTQMQLRGQITNCVVDGPLAFDNAVSIKAAQDKGIESSVAGKADILMVPSIEVGNALYKSFIYFANAKVAAVISGAKAPIVLTSRSDSHESKVYSLVLSLLTSNQS